MGFALPFEGQEIAQPEAPEAPTEGEPTISVGVAASIICLCESNGDQEEVIIVSNDPLYSFPQFPAVAFYNFATGASVTAATLGATWERHEITPGLPGLTVKFANLSAVPLKKGEVLAICVTG